VAHARDASLRMRLYVPQRVAASAPLGSLRLLHLVLHSGRWRSAAERPPATPEARLSLRVQCWLGLALGAGAEMGTWLPTVAWVEVLGPRRWERG
jgi:hypothetical protein